MRLCDLDEIKVCVDRQYENCHGYSGSKKAIYREAILAVKSILHSAKPIDAVPVVRCRECKYHEEDLCLHCDIPKRDYDPSDPDCFACSDCACYHCIYLHSCEGQCAKGGSD